LHSCPRRYPASVENTRVSAADKVFRNDRQFLRQNHLSNRVFETYEEILDAACDAWNRLIDQPWRIMSIGMRDWAHKGQSF
jgi:hypothetical protein